MIARFRLKVTIMPISIREIPMTAPKKNRLSRAVSPEGSAKERCRRRASAPWRGGASGRVQVMELDIPLDPDLFLDGRNEVGNDEHLAHKRDDRDREKNRADPSSEVECKCNADERQGLERIDRDEREEVAGRDDVRRSDDDNRRTGS